ncbi:MAG: hypothetical protein JKY49_06855 [Cohaesibacteraceae bacterium]|nr:hypothetical protein [Cohaesibacteraceae bacterium]MBL4876722.1 hypothetical protein [Cohaesibacteraceae bacterium]
MANTSLIPIDFNIIVNETQSLHGSMISATPGGIDPVRKNYNPSGSLTDRNPIVSFKFSPFKFKVTTYPKGLASLPVGEKIILSFREYLVDDVDQTEMGIRHYYEGELDPPKESERKSGDLVEWDYEVMNTSVYIKYVDETVVDEARTKPDMLMLNGNVIFSGRNRILGIKDIA